MRIEVLLDLKTRLGESPVWDVEQQRLWWVDSLDGRLFACNAQGGAIKSWDVRQKIGSFALRQNGEGAVVALQSRITDPSAVHPEAMLARIEQDLRTTIQMLDR